MQASKASQMTTDMKPSPCQIFFADDWLQKTWIGSFVTFAMAYSTIHFLPTFHTLGFSIYSIVLAVVILIAGAIGFLASLILGCMILPRIYFERELMNGAPFQKGDLVVILQKKHRGRLAWVLSPGDPMYGASLKFVDANDSEKPISAPLHAFCRAPRGTETSSS